MDLHEPSPKRVLRWIAGVELFKGALAVAGAVSLGLAGPQPLKVGIARFARHLHLDPLQGTLGKIMAGIDANKVHLAVMVAAAYALMRFVEGYGLWREREWASWFGAISAGVYLPIEVLALFKHPHWLEASILLMNIAVVLYLIHDIRRRHRPKKNRV